MATSLLVRSFEERFYEALKLRDLMVNELKELNYPYHAKCLSFEFSSRHVVMDMVRRLIENSKHEILAIMTPSFLIRSVYSFKEEFKNATVRGVEVLIISSLSQTPREVIYEAMKWSMLKELEEVAAKVLLKDGEEVLLIPGRGTLNSRVDYERGVCLSNRDIVNAMRRMFFSLWSSAQDANATLLQLIDASTPSSLAWSLKLSRPLLL